VLHAGGSLIFRKNAEIVADVDGPGCGSCFSLGETLTLTWSNVMKLAQSLLPCRRLAMEPLSPRSSAHRFEISSWPGSYTRQDYIDRWEGATMSGRLAAAVILDQAGTAARQPLLVA